ncbi:MAG: glycosyltransferase [Sandaracinaceae bacterium]
MSEQADRESLPSVAVLVATRNRASELANRSLRAVATQTWAPDFLVVVDDSDRRHRDDNRRIVSHAALPRTRIKYLENDRTRGASGGWNVGLDWLTREVEDPSTLFVAILDDDDAWDSTYLEECLGAASAGGLDMIAADIVRHESAGSAVTCRAPEELDTRSFLVGNPHIQGSNLFVRLSTLLAAGTFDESLPSTTDRDVCIRIADLADTRYARLARALVHHHAEPGRARLSSKGSAAKLAGLTAFWRKYMGRMTEAERRAFADRAERLFGWSEPGLERSTLAEPPQWVAPDPAARVALVVGVIASAANAAQVASLAKELAGLTTDRRLANLDLVLLENGPRPPASGLEDVVADARRAGIGCFFLPLEQQTFDAAAGHFGRPFDRGLGRASIATARTMLQAYLHDLAKRRPGAVVWILDEDMQLETLAWRAGRGVASEPLAVVDVLDRLREQRVDVAIGTVTDAPPLPFASCVRTQLVDAYHNLEWLAALEPSHELPDRSAENMALRARCEDYYYDLSRRETDHLESPFWITPSTGSATARDAFISTMLRLPRILAGEQVFRPLLVDGAVDPVAMAKPSVHRGGNAFVFDPEALRDFPNAVPEVEGQSTRRSDMVWSLLNRYVAGRTVVRIPFAVRQDRRRGPVGGLDLGKLCRDIQGFALYSALEALCLEKLEVHRAAGAGGVPDLSRFAERDVTYTIRKFRKFLRERTAAFALSFHRAAGLAHALSGYFEPSRADRYWWLGDAECAAAVTSAREFLAVLRAEYDVKRLAEFRRRVNVVSDDVVREYLAELEGELAARRSATRSGPVTWIDEQRIENARAWLGRAFAHRDALRLLGTGSEAVVLTDGRTVYKYIDYWKGRDHEERLAFLHSLVGRFEGATSLYPLREVRADRARVVLTYDYEPSVPYRGGYASGLLTLLHDCRRAGVVCTNIHPDNLVVVGPHVKLVDYGSDVRPYDDRGFRRMARRAFLTAHHSANPELKTLMRRSIDDEALPELAGFVQFWSAFHPPSKETLVDDRLVQAVREIRPARLLDYGCGRGRLAARLAQEGIAVTAYDPDASLAEHWRDATGPGFLTRGEVEVLRSREQSAFDAVVCCLVLCTLGDEDARSVLDDVRALLHRGGSAILVVCNPRHVGCHTALQHRVLPSAWEPEESFAYTKLVRSSGRLRHEVHRPMRHYEEMFRAAALRVESIDETPGVNVDTMEPASDFMIFRCRAEGP